MIVSVGCGSPRLSPDNSNIAVSWNRYLGNENATGTLDHFSKKFLSEIITQRLWLTL